MFTVKTGWPALLPYTDQLVPYVKGKKHTQSASCLLFMELSSELACDVHARHLRRVIDPAMHVGRLFFC